MSWSDYPDFVADDPDEEAKKILEMILSEHLTMESTIQLYAKHLADQAKYAGAFVEMNYGALAQLGERCNGIAEVEGSIPSGSTKEENE